MFQLGQEITLDEQKCAFRGMIRFRVYMKNKPHKYGIKLFMKCDAVTGFPLTFEVYTGSDQNDPKANAVQNMVQRLAKPFKGKAHIFYMDRYFCAPGIANKLHCKGMNVVSTCRKD